jgi:hypothetical protein
VAVGRTRGLASWSGRAQVSGRAQGSGPLRHGRDALAAAAGQRPHPRIAAARRGAHQLAGRPSARLVAGPCRLRRWAVLARPPQPHAFSTLSLSCVTASAGWVQVRVKWWGEEGYGSLLRPAACTGLGPALTSSLFYSIRCSRSARVARGVLGFRV